ncbi:MAG: Mrp/NBP35 family ATP-binding protein [archaeon]|nr:Mrp/NBP35 family ATP-binding protein [archaeon]
MAQIDNNERMKIINERMGDIKHKIVVMSGKGGVGKTTVAVNLAIKLAATGNTVGIIDVDITGPNVPHMLKMEGLRPEVNPEKRTFSPVIGPMNLRVMSMAFLLESQDTPVIWRGPMKMSAIRQFLSEAEWGKLDYMIFDLPPGTSDETLDILQIIDDAGVIIVTTPQDVALLDSRKTVNMSKQMNQPALDKYDNDLKAHEGGFGEKPEKPQQRKMLGIVENMSGFKCPHCNEHVELFGMGGGKKAAEELSVPFLGAIPFEVDVRVQGDAGMPFIIKYPDSESGKAFEEIIKKVVKMMQE